MERGKQHQEQKGGRSGSGLNGSCAFGLQMLAGLTVTGLVMKRERLNMVEHFTHEEEEHVEE